MLFFIFCWLLPSLIEIAIAQDGRFNCPNNGVPKRDDRSGRLIQCLPGRSSTAICGSDHACFFSGFNYHCCPSVRDDQEGQSREEVDSGGGADEEECPGSALVVLDSNGGPIRCTKLGQCPMPEMFCHGGLGDTSICCESFTHEKAGEQRVSKEAGTMVAVTEKTIRKAEAALKPNMGTTSTPSTFALPNIIIKSQSDIRGKHEIRQNIADNEIRSETEKDNETESQRESVEIGGGQKGKNLLDDSFNEIHNISSSRSGDYASSRNGLIVEQEAKTVGQEQLAKQFLLEQIRRGWPYNEKFYRPKAESEDIFVLRKRGKPQAIVHFPN